MSSSAESGPRVAVLASGRGSNFESLAAAFRAGEIPGSIVLLVVDKPGAGAVAIAERFGIPWLLVRGRRDRDAFDAALLDVLRQHAVEYVFLAGFLRILGRTAVEAYWGRILNIHPSLLPSFPGLHAQAQALAAGVEESGCTVHFVDFGVDTGPAVLQRRVPVLPEDDEDSLAARILREEHRAYPEAARRVLSGSVRIEDLRTEAGRRQRNLTGGT
jgi:phosphoribosylglycinamide formyltransferase 1